jgi:hypothetical protein
MEVKIVDGNHNELTDADRRVLGLDKYDKPTDKTWTARNADQTQTIINDWTDDEYDAKLATSQNYVTTLEQFAVVSALLFGAALGELNVDKFKSWQAQLVHYLLMAFVCFVTLYGAAASTCVIMMMKRISHRDEWYRDWYKKKAYYPDGDVSTLNKYYKDDYNRMCKTIGFTQMKNDDVYVDNGGRLLLPMQFVMAKWALGHYKNHLPWHSRGIMQPCMFLFPYAMFCFPVSVAIRLVFSTTLPLYAQLLIVAATAVPSLFLFQVTRICTRITIDEV